jgi:hypothetical protein
MTISDSPSSKNDPRTISLLERTRHALTGRRVLWAVAAVVAALGLTLRWNWLVAAGVAPVLVSLLPCAAMCAFGFCAFKAVSPAPAAQSRIDTESNSEPGDKN